MYIYIYIHKAENHALCRPFRSPRLASRLHSMHAHNTVLDTHKHTYNYTYSDTSTSTCTYIHIYIYIKLRTMYFADHFDRQGRHPGYTECAHFYSCCCQPPGRSLWYVCMCVCYSMYVRMLVCMYVCYSMYVYTHFYSCCCQPPGRSLWYVCMYVCMCACT